MEAIREFFERQVPKRMLYYGIFLLVVLILQNMIFCEFRPLGVSPMIFPAVAVAVGMFEGVTWGTVFSLILGLFADMAYVESTVMFTILMPALAFFAGFVSQFFINRRFFAYMGAAFVGLAITAAAQLLRVATAEGLAGVMINTAILQVLWSLPFAVVVYFPPAKWIE